MEEIKLSDSLDSFLFSFIVLQWIFLLLNLIAIKQISDILQTGLDKDGLTAIMYLLEQGYNPEGVVALVRRIQKDTDSWSLSIVFV